MINKPFAFEISTTENSMYFVAEKDKVSHPAILEQSEQWYLDATIQCHLAQVHCLQYTAVIHIILTFWELQCTPLHICMTEKKQNGMTAVRPTVTKDCTSFAYHLCILSLCDGVLATCLICSVVVLSQAVITCLLSVTAVLLLPPGNMMRFLCVSIPSGSRCNTDNLLCCRIKRIGLILLAEQ